MSKTKMAGWIVVLLMLSASLAACAGLELGDLVRVRTPPDVQQLTGAPGYMTLNEAESAYQAWLADTQRIGATWKSNIERGNEVRGLLNQLTLSVLDEYGPMVAGFPVIGPLLPLVTGLGGLFLGTNRLRKEKEASFRKGQEEAARIVKTGP